MELPQTANSLFGAIAQVVGWLRPRPSDYAFG